MDCLDTNGKDNKHFDLVTTSSRRMLTFLPWGCANESKSYSPKVLKLVSGLEKQGN